MLYQWEPGVGLGWAVCHEANVISVYKICEAHRTCLNASCWVGGLEMVVQAMNEDAKKGALGGQPCLKPMEGCGDSRKCRQHVWTISSYHTWTEGMTEGLT